MTNPCEEGIIKDRNADKYKSENFGNYKVFGWGKNKMGIDFERINAEIRILQAKGIVNPHFGTAKKAVPVQIKSVADHAFRHGISKEQAQGFIDTAEVMFNQGNRNMYLSRDGSATVIMESNRLISAYGKNEFDRAIKAVWKVIDNERHS